MKKRFDYDLAILGSGDAGGEAALIAAKSGLKVALIESQKWGGSSLNYTNVPLGALFHATQLFRAATEGARFGLSSANLRYNYPTLNNWKNVAMKRAHANSKKDFEEAGIDCVHGHGHLLSKHEVSVGDQKVIKAKNILLATGAEMLDTGITIPENYDYWLPENVLDMIRPPKTIFIVGAGPTGCEFAQFFATLGTEVIIAEIAGRLLPREDEEVGQVLDETFNKQGIKVLTQSRVIALEKDGVSKKVIFLRGGQEKSVRVDQVLLCTGSAPSIDLGLENADVKFTRNGIQVDNTMRTSQKNIYAAGDVVGGHSSTEKALIDARVAVSHIIGRSKAVVDYRGVIRVTNIAPEVAQLGATEDDCIRADRKIKKIILPLSVVQKSNITDEDRGFIKLICTKKGDKLIGATIMAPNAGLMMQELSMAMMLDLSVYDIAHLPHLANDWGELIRTACERI